METVKLAIGILTKPHKKQQGPAFINDTSRLPFINGFTLIELLMVVLIIGIVTSVATLSIRTNQTKEVESTASRIINLLLLAETEALLRSSLIGIQVSPHGLTFYQYQENKKTPWQPLSHSAFKPFLLPKNQFILLKRKPDEKRNYDILLFPSGDITPFILQLGIKNNPPYEEIVGKQNGHLFLRKKHDAP